MMRKSLLWSAKIFVDVVNFLGLLICFFVLSTVRFTKETFGDVSLPQLLFFVFYGGSEGVETELVNDVVMKVFLIPFLGTCGVFYFLRKVYNGEVLFCNKLFLFVYIVFLILVGGVFYKYLGLFTISDVYSLVVLLFVVYLINVWRSYDRGNFFICLVMALVLVGVNPNNARLVKTCFEFEKTNFYENNYKFLDKNIGFSDKRNVIVVFAESFENRFAKIEEDGKVYKINDENAVKFRDLREGWSQNWTQGALFSAFTGTHIHYLSEFFRYGVKGFKYNLGERILLATNELGENFDFNTPNIRYLGDISSENGYNNLFVQGGKLEFSGTDKFLLNHGFSKDRIFSMDDFKDKEEYERAKNWWGVSDRLVFEKFKQELGLLDKEKPFMAVMFTLDLHRGNNPFYKNENESVKANIDNLNDFIEWFEGQDFYENTTLVIVGDHRKMGQNALIGGGVYNAFFNLPERLKSKIDVNRIFNQVDMMPTILEIMGAKLDEQGAGIGVSLFGAKKTIAERYSYEEQEEIFSKIDRFYQRIWEEKEIIKNNKLSKIKKNDEIFIAHAGGGIDGNIYTNSLEAMVLAKERGYKYIELDLITVNIPPYNIIATHDCNTFNKMSLKKCGDVIDFDNDKLLGKYSILNEESILRFFRENKDLWLVTDKIDDFSLLNEKFFELKDRMIVEVFSIDKYFEAKKFGFARVAYNVRNKNDIEKVKKHGVSEATMSLGFANNNFEEVLSLKQKGVKILGYSANNFKKVREMLDVVDMFYYDGEESLNGFAW